LDRYSTHSKHIHNYINKLRETSLSFSFATFYLAFRNKAIQRKVRKVITVFMKINEGIFISSSIKHGCAKTKYFS
jgi:aminoglycoside/choline kinase family phosphotransferase